LFFFLMAGDSNYEMQQSGGLLRAAHRRGATEIFASGEYAEWIFRRVTI